MKKLIVSIVAMLAVTAAFATPTFYGATGGLATITAKTTPAPVINSYFYQQEDLRLDVEAAFPIETVPGLELSGMYTNYDVDGFDIDGFAAGAKYALPINAEGFSVAVGGYYSDTFTSCAYGAGTYTFAELPLDVTAQILYDFDAEDVYFNALAEYSFNFEGLNSPLAFGVEYIGHLEINDFNIYLRANDISNGIGATIGAVTLSNDASLVAGLSYTF